jgi:hypothetical protein
MTPNPLENPDVVARLLALAGLPWRETGHWRSVRLRTSTGR